jgi:hypothetical protein
MILQGMVQYLPEKGRKGGGMKFGIFVGCNRHVFYLIFEFKRIIVRISDFGFMISDLEFEIWNLEFEIWNLAADR